MNGVALKKLLGRGGRGGGWRGRDGWRGRGGGRGATSTTTSTATITSTAGEAAVGTTPPAAVQPE